MTSFQPRTRKRTPGSTTASVELMGGCVPRPSRWAAYFAALVVVVLASAASAVHPGQWEHTTEADFEAGETDNAVVTNLGDIKLGPRLTTVAELPGDEGVIYDMAVTAEGVIYIAAGPKGSLARYRGDQVATLVDLPDEQIFCIEIAADGRLLVGISGDNSRVAVFDSGKQELSTVAELPGVRYVWDMLVDGPRVLAATGTDGQLLLIDSTKLDKDGLPTITELLDTAQSNILCLGRDAKGQIYAGTDTDGLVYRVAVQSNGQAKSFVVYDAPEPEIGALLVTADGTVYAGTADADQARPGRLEQAIEIEAGRPEVQSPMRPDGKDPGGVPKVPADPDPVDTAQDPPGDPPPTEPSVIPQTTLDPPVGATPSAPDADARAYTTRTSNGPIQGLGTGPDAAADPSAKGASDQDAAKESGDRLRRLIIELLLSSHKVAPPPDGQKTAAATARVAAARANRSSNRRGSAVNGRSGNAIYRISPDGFVTEVFRESVMILDMLVDPFGHDRLLVSTGNEGQIFRVDPDAEEKTAVADLDPQQIPAIVRDNQGHVLIGTANPATVVRLERGFAERGKFTSPVLEAAQTSLWGKLNLTAQTPPKTTISVETRSGNVADPEQAPWSDWTGLRLFEHAADTQPQLPRTVAIQSPPAKYLQYRLIFTGNIDSTPVVDRVELTYVVPNLTPVVSSITATYGDAESNGGAGRRNPGNANDQEPEHDPVLNITWEASDPNGDSLRYTLEYAAAGKDVWMTIDDELTDPAYKWQTRRVPDGWYVNRVTASDRPDNPSDMAQKSVRRSDPVMVDNTPPVINAVVNRPGADGRLTVTTTAKDQLSLIDQVSYAIDSGDKWEPLLPDDLIYDSTSETFTIKMPDLASGQHVVVVRAVDFRGNASYKSVYLEK